MAVRLAFIGLACYGLSSCEFLPFGDGHHGDYFGGLGNPFLPKSYVPPEIQH